jgi:uncharacterized repeat protein (TIGR01451 family)
VSRNIIERTNNSSLGVGIGIQTFPIGVSTSNIPARRNRVTKNAIYDTLQGPGIDLWTQGQPGTTPRITANDGLKNPNQANEGMDYPIITSSVLTSGALTVKGYVGNTPAGSPSFANSTLEFFIADNTPADQNGEVIVGDGKSLPHGEGKTYIDSCTTDANSKFNCTFGNAGTLGLVDPKNITATATDTLGNTSEFSSVPSDKANVLMVKRITAIKDVETKVTTSYNTFVDDTTSTTATNDNNCGWPGATPVSGVCTNNTYTVGATSATALKVKPGDEIEYTIYYLNAGGNKAIQARICDQLDSNLTFQDDTPTTPATTAPLDIRKVAGAGAIVPLTNAANDDAGELITNPAVAGASCNLAANTGTNLSNNVVVVDIGNTTNPLMGSTGAGIPTTSYGYIRFKTTVK